MSSKETTPAMITDAKDAFAFLMGGNATMTFVSKKTGTRYTFKIRKPEEGDAYFVSLLTGSDNQADYSYVGMLAKQYVGSRNDGSRMLMFRLTKKSKLNEESAPVKAFRWVFGALVASAMPPGTEIWHEGKCGRCGRALTVPSSLASGFGPECSQKMGVAA
jgi:hypothetical protein